MKQTETYFHHRIPGLNFSLLKVVEIVWGWDDILGKAIMFTTAYDSKPQSHTCGLARKDKLKGKFCVFDPYNKQCITLDFKR